MRLTKGAGADGGAACSAASRRRCEGRAEDPEAKRVRAPEGILVGGGEDERSESGERGSRAEEGTDGEAGTEGGLNDKRAWACPPCIKNIKGREGADY